MCPHEPCVASILMFPFKSKDVWLMSFARLIDVLSEKKDICVSPLSLLARVVLVEVTGEKHQGILKSLSMWEDEEHIQEGCQ